MSIDVPKAHALELLRKMMLMRRLEEKSAELYTQEKIRGFLHLYVGQEAVGTGAMMALRDEDNVVATYREHAQAYLRGVSPGAILAEMYGKANGCSRGRGGSMHLFSVERRFFGGHGIVAAGLPIAVGLALADKMQGREAVTACFFGDGAAEEGEFHESLNLAALWELPVLFLCENNLYAMGTAIALHASDPELSRRPGAYRIPADSVDGMDVLAVERAVRYAADTVRSTSRPRFLELRTYRFRAHSMFDPDRYRPKEEFAAWRERDPIEHLAREMRAASMLTDEDLAAIVAEVDRELAEAVAFAEAGPLEPIEDLDKDLYARVVP